MADRDDVKRLDAAMRREAEISALRTQLAALEKLRGDVAPPLTLGDLPAKKIFELVDGNLYINGVWHGNNSHARTLLHLIAHPPPEPTPITVEAVDRKFDNGQDTAAHVDWEKARRRGSTVREDWLRYTVTEMPPNGPIDGLLLVVDDGQPLIYGYLQVAKSGEAGGHNQALIANGATDFTTDERQAIALQVFRAAAGNG